MKFALLLVAVAIAQCQTAHDTHDPSVVLDQARARLQAMAHTLEQYVCIETVNRSYYQRVVPGEAPPRPEGEPVCGDTAAGGASPTIRFNSNPPTACASR